VTLENHDQNLKNLRISSCDLFSLGSTQSYQAWISNTNLNYSVSALGSENNRSLMMHKTVNTLGFNLIPFFPPIDHTLDVLCIKSVDMTSSIFQSNKQEQFDLYQFSGTWIGNREERELETFEFSFPVSPSADIIQCTEVLKITKNYLGRISHKKDQLFELDDFPLADGAITDCPWIAPGVTVADCYPIFLGGISEIHQGKRVVGTLHSGWKGTGILAVGAYGLQELWGIPFQKIEVILGPGICGTCYPVGQERAQILQKRFGLEGIVQVSGMGEYEGILQPGLDLPKMNKLIVRHLQLKDCTEVISCTYENTKFWSHRRYQSGRRAWEANGISVQPQDKPIDGRMFAFVTPLGNT